LLVGDGEVVLQGLQDYLHLFLHGQVQIAAMLNALGADLAPILDGNHPVGLPTRAAAYR
jgi:hypothetical protein